MIYTLLLFYAGILVQAVFLLFNNFKKNDIWLFLGSIGFALIGFVPGKHEYNYDLFLHLFGVAVCFAIAYGTNSKEPIPFTLFVFILTLFFLAK